MSSEPKEQQSGMVAALNISVSKGTIKTPVPSVVITRLGVEGDAHAGSWHRQVSLLSEEEIQQFGAEHGRSFGVGEFAENITTSGLDLSTLALFDTLKIGDVTLMVTQIGKACHGRGCAIYQHVGACIMPKRGVFCQVLATGNMTVGQSIAHFPRSFKIKIITLSDRAASGEYEDLSGPEVQRILTDHFSDKPWRFSYERVVLPDDQQSLSDAVCAATRDHDGAMIFTTGGTGIAPRDITVDTVTPLLDKTLPGIMDAIRMKYGAHNPAALLSRSIAGVRDQSLIYTLPGSPKAVSEYMQEIVKTLEHLLFTLHGVARHG